MPKIRKAILAAISLTLALFLTSLPLLPSFAVLPDYPMSDSYISGRYYTNLLNVTLTGDMRKDIVAVAKSQVGYHESSSRSNLSGDSSGGSNYVEYFNYIDFYNSTYKGWHESLQAQGGWCGAFVAFCAFAAGVPFSVILPSAQTNPTTFGFGGTSPLEGSKLMNFYDLAVKGGSYIPEPGDIIFFGKSNSRSNPLNVSYKHVGIVSSCDMTYGEDGLLEMMTINTVEGNTSDSVTEKHWKMKADSSGWIYDGMYIAAFGVPAYIAGSPSNPVFDLGPYGGTVLKKGMTTDAVIPLKVAFNLLSYLNGGSAVFSVTGLFGDVTESTVKDFQKKYGLEVDGIVGSETWNKLRTVLVSLTSSHDGEFLMRGNTLLAYFGRGKEAILPDNCTAVAPYAFFGNDTVKTLSVPRTFTTFDDNALEGCSSIEKLIFRGTEKEAKNMNRIPEKGGKPLIIQYVPVRYDVIFKTVSGTQTVSCQIDCLPEYTPAPRVEKDGKIYYFKNWNKPLVPAVKNDSYTAEYFTVSADPVELSGSNTVCIPGKTAAVSLEVSSPEEISTFIFDLDYSPYADLLSYAGMSSSLRGVAVDDSVPGILTVYSNEEFLPVSGDLILSSLLFEVADEVYDSELYLTMNNASFGCSDGNKDYPLNVVSGMATVTFDAGVYFDFDKSGNLDIADVTMLLDALSTNTLPEVYVGNGTETIENFDIGDVTALLDILAKGTV